MSELIEKPKTASFQGESPPQADPGVVDDSHVEVVEAATKKSAPAAAEPVEEIEYQIVEVEAQPDESQQTVVIQGGGGGGGGGCSAVGCICVTLVLLGILAIPIYLVEKTGDLFGGIGNFFSKAIDGFSSREIETEFLESKDRVFGTEGDILEIAINEASETMSTTEKNTLGWGLFDASEVKVKFFFRVTYRYHLKISDTWKLTSDGDTCYVLAPKIRASQPPAIDTNTLRWEFLTDVGIFTHDDENAAARARKGITAKLMERAESEEHVDKVREEARESVEKFVKNWLMDEGYWNSNNFAKVEVMFSDEVNAQRSGEMEEVGPSTPKPKTGEIQPE